MRLPARRPRNWLRYRKRLSNRMSSKETDLIQVMIVAPSQAMRAGLRSLLSGDAVLTVTGEAASLAGVGAYTWREVDVLLKAAADNGMAASLSDLQANLPGSEPFPALLLLSDEAESIGALNRTAAARLGDPAGGCIGRRADSRRACLARRADCSRAAPVQPPDGQPTSELEKPLHSTPPTRLWSKP